MKQNKTLDISSLSSYLFWEVDHNSLDPDKNFRYILTRVLEYGSTNDWRKLCKYYGLGRIAAEAKKIRSLDNKSLYFVAQITNSNLEEFRCYTSNQLTQGHWNF